jgi:hypothetical protein
MRITVDQPDIWKQQCWFAPTIGIENLPSEILEIEPWIRTLPWLSSPYKTLKITTLLMPVKLREYHELPEEFDLIFRRPPTEQIITHLFAPDYQMRDVGDDDFSLAITVVEKNIIRKIRGLVVKQTGSVHERVGTYWMQVESSGAMNMDGWPFSLFPPELGGRLATCYII